VYDAGYKRGFDDGRHDARDRRPSDYSRHDDYRNAERNDRRVDARIFREGYVAGYNDGYRRNVRDDQDGRRGGPSPDFGRGPSIRDGFRSPASENGYRDGYAQGREDARDGDRNDPLRASRYRSGDHDYHGRYGPRDDYKRDYRAAFVQGYEQGYRESRRR
jgi:hypothetical protein